MERLIVFATFAVALTAGLYGGGDDVIELTGANFHKDVVMSDDLWLVEFYAPWCGHCKSLAPEWKKAAKALKGVVKIAAVDADQHGELGGQFGVKGFPTIKVFGADKFKPTDYQGGRTANAIVDAALAQVKAIVNQRLTGKSGGGGGSKSGGGGGGAGGKVITLTDENFDEMVMQSADPWLVEFYAPWCGHCQKLEPEWAQAAGELKGKVKLGALDATVHQQIAQKYGVRGYPTIKFFAAGVKKDAQEYDGGRDAAAIVAWAEQRAEVVIEPPEVYQLTDQAVLDTCKETQLCVISFLPHIYDCQSQCRNDYVKILKEQGEKFKKFGWGWLWVEAGSQPKLEESVDVGGFGYPAQAAVNTRKNIFAPLRGPFSSTGIYEFLRDLSYGKGATMTIRGGEIPAVSKVDKWDGKDKALPVSTDDEDLPDLEPLDMDDGEL